MHPTSSWNNFDIEKLMFLDFKNLEKKFNNEYSCNRRFGEYC